MTSTTTTETRMTLCKIGFRRGTKELKKRGYSEPTRYVRNEPTVVGIGTSAPGLLPGGIYNINEDCENPRSAGMAFVSASWTGEWGAWGWDMDRNYWSVHRKVRKHEAMAEIRKGLPGARLSDPSVSEAPRD